MNTIKMVRPDEDAPPARPAATVVVFRRDPSGGDAQLLLVERSGSMVFAGGATVFPGGKVDPADRELARALFSGESGPDDGQSEQDKFDDLAARVAAVRETLEETGLVIGITGDVDAARAARARQALLEGNGLGPVLAEMGWRLDLSSLVAFARWLPRHREVRVYDTRFYLANVGTGDLDLIVDATENRHLFWASARDALRLADEGRIKVIFPTRRNLERLAQWPEFALASAHARATPIRVISPQIELREGVRWLTIPTDAGYPIDGEPLADAARG